MIIRENNLVIESITLLDGVTPDEEVQYKVGRKVAHLVSEGEGSHCYVYYDADRVWRTYPLTEINFIEGKIVLKDKQSIYTFSKQKGDE